MTTNRFAFLLLILLARSWTCDPAEAARVGVEIAPRDVGIEGHVRPGAWTGVHATVVNHTGDVIRARCRWLLADADGDLVAVERKATLSPNQRHRLWLYAPVPAAWNMDTLWRFEVIEDAKEEMLAATAFSPSGMIDPLQRAVGVLGPIDLGLAAYAQRYTQHEACAVITGMISRKLPDRWYGLSAIESLVWPAAGGSPDATDVRPEARRALRHWVERGGHLVIIMSSGVEMWQRSSLADLLPPVETPQRIKIDPPRWLGQPSPPDATLDAYKLVPREGTDVVLRSPNVHTGHEVGVATQIGFGRVTLVGIDLADASLARYGLPKPLRSAPGSRTLWHALFGWQAPIFERSKLEAEVDNNTLVPPALHRPIVLDQEVIAAQTTMASTAVGSLLVAITFFIAYGLVAGPLSFAWLRARKAAHLAWVVFGGLVLLFSLVSWGGAYVIRPHRSQIEHFTVLDAVSDDPSRPLETQLRLRSWMALLVARHGRADIALERPPDAGVDAAPNTLGCFGFGAAREATQFASAQRYRLRAGSPDEIDLPVRSTAKLLRADYLTGADARFHPRQGTWRLPQGLARLGRDDDGNLTLEGTLVHRLPGPLREVRLVCLAGERHHAVTWLPFPGPWAPGQVLNLALPAPGYRIPLITDPIRVDFKQRDLRREGHLGALMAGRARAAPGGRHAIPRGIELLTFFGLLPAPDFRNVGNVFTSDGSVTTYLRRQGRDLDLSHMAAGRRLMIIGHLEGAPAPLPLRVDDTELTSRGWTTVRWMCRL